MTTAAPAETTVDSATTQEVTTTSDFNAGDPSTWKPGEYEEFNRTGKIPAAPVKSSDSATDKKDQKTAETADSATAKKTADTASESATDKDQKPNLKTKEDTERRIAELLEKNKKFERELEELRKGKTATSTETRDGKSVSQPTTVEKKDPGPLRAFLVKYFEEHKDAKYEEGAEAWHIARDAYKDQENQRKIDQALASERNRLAQEAVAKGLATQLEDMKQRYQDFDPAKLDSAAGELLANDVPMVVKQMVGSSKVFGDLMYVLAGDENFSELVALCKTDPLEAMRRIAVTESLVKDRIAGKKSGGEGADGKARDASGKFVSSESTETTSEQPKPRAPKPISDVGGRGTAPPDASRAAAAAGKFADFEAAENAKKFKRA